MEFIGEKAIYLQIADYIWEQIILQRWLASEKIPSVRELAITLEVNPNTVMRTYAFLEESKIITMKRGIGYFVAEDAVSRVMQLKQQEFINQDLPQVFKMMDLLKIDLNQLVELYHQTRAKSIVV